MPMIDTHCHLTYPEFADRIPEVLARAHEAGVKGMITISTHSADADMANALAASHEHIWCTAGVHPLNAHLTPHRWDWLAELGAHPKCVAWGELGLDNHYEHPAPAIQHRALDEQLAMIVEARGRGLKLPLVLHCRDAFDDLLPVLAASGLDPQRMVFHCFTGTEDEARRVLDFGAWISFTGIVTYRNAPSVREAAKLTPIDRIMVETDAPYLSPEPHRTKRPCEPWMSSVTASFIADLRGMARQEFEQAINRNTEAFFGVRAD